MRSAASPELDRPATAAQMCEAFMMLCSSSTQCDCGKSLLLYLVSSEQLSLPRARSLSLSLSLSRSLCLSLFLCVCVMCDVCVVCVMCVCVCVCVCVSVCV